MLSLLEFCFRPNHVIFSLNIVVVAVSQELNRKHIMMLHFHNSRVSWDHISGRKMPKSVKIKMFHGTDQYFIHVVNFFSMIISDSCTVLLILEHNMDSLHTYSRLFTQLIYRSWLIEPHVADESNMLIMSFTLLYAYLSYCNNCTLMMLSGVFHSMH